MNLVAAESRNIKLQHIKSIEDVDSIRSLCQRLLAIEPIRHSYRSNLTEFVNPRSPWRRRIDPSKDDIFIHTITAGVLYLHPLP